MSPEAVRKAMISRRITDRYTFQDLGRSDWTAKQKRRMRKKFKKHGITPYESVMP